MTDTRRKMSLIKASQLWDALRSKPRTVRALAELVDLDVRPVRNWLNHLHECNRARIIGYVEDDRGRAFTPLWGAGKGEHTPRPGRRPGAAAKRMRRMRERKKIGRQDGVGVEDLV